MVVDSLRKPPIEKKEGLKPLEKAAELEMEREKTGLREKEAEMRKMEKLPEGEGVGPVISQPTVGAPGIDTTKSETHQLVEAILEENLEDLYFSMDEKHQMEFKQKGEEVAGKIVKLLETAKATFKRVFDLIKSWLKIIPGVSKFFIEQEAKIKADRILETER